MHLLKISLLKGEKTKKHLLPYAKRNLKSGTYGNSVMKKAIEAVGKFGNPDFGSDFFVKF